MPNSPLSPLHEEMRAAHGELIQGEPLRRALGFRSTRSFYRAIAAEQIPVDLFRRIEKGPWLARTRDVSRWLESAGADAGRNDTRKAVRPTRNQESKR